MGRRGRDRGARPHRRDRRPPRLPPPHLQRAHRAARGRARAPRVAVLGSARHVRVPRRAHRAHPLHHLCARAAVPPSTGDREALRDARRGQQRPSDPRRRRRHLEGGVRPRRCSPRRARTTVRRRHQGASRVALQRSPSTTASTTTSRVSSSTRVPFRSTCRSGSAGGRSARCDAPSTLTDGWCPFAVPPGQAAEWLAKVDVPPGFEVVLPPTERLDPVNEPAKTQEVLAADGGVGRDDRDQRFRERVVAALPRPARGTRHCPRRDVRRSTRPPEKAGSPRARTATRSSPCSCSRGTRCTATASESRRRGRSPRRCAGTPTRWGRRIWVWPWPRRGRCR